MSDTSLDADILVVGGGIQGVVLLHELIAAGARRVLLASAGELGRGETLHSHGYLHRGFAMATSDDAASLVQELEEAAGWWIPRLRPPYAPGPPVFFGLPESDANARSATWKSLGLDHREVHEIPDALRGGGADREGVRLFAIADRLVSMPALLGELAAPLQAHMVRGRVTALELGDEGTRVSGCRLSAGGAELVVRPRLVVLACGREAQPLLRSARTPSGRQPLENGFRALNRIRFVPMFLVRGSDLPQVSGIFQTHAISVFTHPVSARESMWIVTLAEGHETDRGNFDPAREEAPGTSFMTESALRLRALVPETDRRTGADLRFSFYFGGKTDHPDGGNRRYVSDCGLANLRLAWPGVWTLAWTNAREIVADLRASSEFAAIFGADRAPLDLPAPGLAAGVPVGRERRLTGAQTWQPWSQLEGLPRGS